MFEKLVNINMWIKQWRKLMNKFNTLTLTLVLMVISSILSANTLNNDFDQNKPADIGDKKWSSLKTAVQEVKLLPSAGGGKDHNFGTSVSVDGNRMVIGAPNYSLNTIVHGAVYVFDFDGSKWEESEILIPLDGNNNDQFGISVSLSGTRLLIGAIGDDDGGNGAGVVFAYDFDGVSWQFMQKLIADDAAPAFEFGISISLSGNRVLIGSDKAHDNFNNTTGAAYVFEFNNNSWSQSKKIVAGDADVGDSFGSSVSLSGNRALIGASLDDDNVANSGSAYVYDFDGNNWNQTQKLTVSNGNSFDLFGLSVSLSGNRVLIGAEGDDDNVSDSGAAYVFDFDGSSWNLTKKIKVFDGGVGDGFGTSVSLLGDRALIGSSLDDDNGINAGAAYIFDLIGNSWSQTQKLTASDTGARDSFGNSVSLSDNRVLIGARKDDSNGDNSGSVYAFDENGGSWEQNQKILAESGTFATSQLFGASVSLSGNRALIGTPFDDSNGNNSGAATIFDFDGTYWTQTQIITAVDGAIDDEFGSSVSLSGDIALIGAPFNSSIADNSGSIYFYEFDGTIWSLTQKSSVIDGANDDNFGKSVSLSGSRALIGANGDDIDNTPNAGSAYIFDFDGNSWNQTQKLIASDASALVAFGKSVSLSGNRALIGTLRDTAYIFNFNGNSWNEVQILTTSDGQTGDLFGNSVSLSDDRVLIGAAFDNDNGALAGSAYIFDFDGNSWNQTIKLTTTDAAEGDRFGESVSLSGNRALIGARLDDDGRLNSGSAYVFDFDGNNWNETQKLIADDNDVNDFFGESVSLSGNRALIGTKLNDDRGTNSGSAYIFTFNNDLIFKNGFE